MKVRITDEGSVRPSFASYAARADRRSPGVASLRVLELLNNGAVAHEVPVEESWSCAGLRWSANFDAALISGLVIDTYQCGTTTTAVPPEPAVSIESTPNGLDLVVSQVDGRSTLGQLQRRVGEQWRARCGLTSGRYRVTDEQLCSGWGPPGEVSDAVEVRVVFASIRGPSVSAVVVHRTRPR